MFTGLAGIETVVGVMIKRSALAVMAAGLAMAFFGQGTVLAKDKPATAARLRSVERELSKTEARKKALLADIEKLRADQKSLAGALVDVAARIQAHEAHMTAAEKRLVRLGLEERILKEKLTLRRASLADMLAALQKLEQHPPPALIVKPGDALGAIRSAMMLASIVPEIRAEANALSQELRRLARLRQEIGGEKKRLKESAVALDKERRRINRLLALKHELTRKTRAEITAERERAVKLAREARSLKELIARFEAIALAARKKAEARRQAAIRARAEMEARKAAEAARKKAENDGAGKVAETAPEKTIEKKKPDARQQLAMLSPSRIKPSKPFEKTKGLLAYPVQGVRVRDFGTLSESGITAKGITIETRKGGQVVSPNDGWVVFAGEFRSYGQLLIINAGGGYHVLLAGMARINVDVGQFVLAGEPVGTMGDHAARSAAIGISGKDTKPLLYVEFRKDSKSIDPSPWWAGHSQKG